jgi:hypothetical protein
MLLVHEVHRVAGANEEAFDALYRDELLPTLGHSEGSRLLWYLRLAHGSGAAYTVVTITGCRDAAAWSDLAVRMRSGDLAGWATRLDGMRHVSEAKLLTPVPWSPLQEIDLSSVPVTPEEHELSLFMEDTAWPFPGKLEEYLAKAGTLYRRTLSESQGRSTRSHRAGSSVSTPLRHPPDDRGHPVATGGQPQGTARPVGSRPPSELQ